MQNKLIMSHSYLVKLPDQPHKQPRQRFVNYYRDLYGLSHQVVSDLSFYQGGQYTYTELADAVLSRYQMIHNMQELDIISTIIWSHEFDPDFSSCTAYLSHHYGIQAELFDFCDNGLLSLCVALHVVKKYMQKRSYKTALLLILEQTTIPYNQASFRDAPKHNFAWALRVECVDSLKAGQISLERSAIFTGASKQTVQPSRIYQRLSHHAGYYPMACAVHRWLRAQPMPEFSIIQPDCESNKIGYLHFRRAA